MTEANITRGEKWTKGLAKAEYENMKEDVKWLNANKNIQEDIKAYKDSLPKPTKSVGKK